jgi:pimeloyl-ACP methyl ester carboxylesterase
MDHLGFETASLVGYSMGGELALTLATMYPERVSRVVMGGAGMMVEGDVGHAFYAYLADVLGSIQPGQTVSEAMGPDLAATDEIRQMFDSNDPAALAATARAMLDLTHDPADLASNDIPILLLIGEDDEFKAQADAALDAGSSIEMHVLSGRNHMNATGHPDFLPTIRSFLSR